MAHGLPGEPGVPMVGVPLSQVTTEAEQHKLDTWQGLYDALEALIANELVPYDKDLVAGQAALARAKQ